MGLRLRRGTNTQRQSIIFAEGELIYTTDTLEIYVGDGSTLGGIKVTDSSASSPASLTQNLNLNSFNISGTGNISATNISGNGSGLFSLNAGNLSSGSVPDARISSTSVTQHQANITGLGTVTSGSIGVGFGNIDIGSSVFTGDGSGLTNLPSSGILPGSNLNVNIVGDDSTVLVDVTTNTLTGSVNLTGDLNMDTFTIFGDGNVATTGDIYATNIVPVNLIASGNVSAAFFSGDGSGLTNLPVVSILDGSNYNINIVGNDSTIIVDVTNNTITGVFVGDGSGLFNLPSGGITPGGDYNINIVGDDSTRIIDVTTNTITGQILLTGDLNMDTFTIYGDGDVATSGDLYATNAIITNVTASGAVSGSIFYGDGSGLTNLPIAPIIEGNNYSINIVGLDSTIIVDATNNTFNGSLIGSVVGDVVGSVFGDNSGLIIDGNNNNVFGNIITASNKFVGDFFEYDNLFTINSTGESGSGFPTVLHRSTDAVSTLEFERVSSTIVDPMNPQFLGQITFTISDPTPQNLLRGIIYSFEESILIAAGVPGFSTTQYNNNQYLHLKDDSLCIGGLSPVEKLDVRGNGIFSGDVSAAAFKGSLMADDSTTIIDGTSGNITAPGYIQFGSFSKPERDSLVASNGFVIYNTTSNRFQGFQNSAWINLDDGTADP